jgi:hypothetical protein
MDVGDRGIRSVERGEERRAQARQQRRLGAVDESDRRAGDVVLKADDGVGGRVLVGKRRPADRRTTCPADGPITRDGWRRCSLDDVSRTGPRLSQLNADDGELRIALSGYAVSANSTARSSAASARTSRTLTIEGLHERAGTSAGRARGASGAAVAWRTPGDVHERDASELTTIPSRRANIASPVTRPGRVDE